MFEMYKNPYNNVEGCTLTGSAGFRLKVGDQVRVGGCIAADGIRNGDIFQWGSDHEDRGVNLIVCQ